MAKRILFVHYGSDWIRGSEKCLLDQIKYVARLGYYPMVWTNNPSLAKQVEMMSLRCQLDEFPLLLGWSKPRLDVSAWSGLVKKATVMLHKLNVDLIHVNSGAPCQWMIPASRATGTPLVTQLHCPYTARDRMTLGIHLSPHVITVSRYVARTLLRDGFDKRRLSVIHNGIDVTALETQPEVNVRVELGLAADDFLFATVGSLIHRKGIDRIITSLRHVVLEYPNTKLVVIGDGPQRDHLEQQCDYLHLQDHVHFVGEQSHVVGWLKGCDAFISGARSEAFGLVVAEAAIAQIPVVAPYEGGIPEFVQHGKTGVLYVNQGYGPMANAMRNMINSEALRDSVVANAYQHITEHYDTSVACANVERVYRKLIKQKQPKKVGVLRTLLPIKTAISNRLSFGGQHG
ncbi:glycosyltransferase family 4 protein [Vibrio scophthalmi]|uniref:glycosyltransferase family 4 protein n=1 Tax=Vibrio scophthalmi TaxID=45658 RepID=UPI002FF1CDDA